MRTWTCPECEYSEKFSYDWIAEHGGPVCEKCDCDMELQPTADNPGVKPYELHIDGHAFRTQRQLLLAIANLVRRKQLYNPAQGDEDVLEGLMNLTDALADQAHDQHGIDCLLG